MPPRQPIVTGATDVPTTRRTWCDLHEDPAITWPPWRARGAGAAPSDADARHPADGRESMRRYRWGVPGFRPDVPRVLVARTPESAGRTLVAALREQGAFGPYRRRLLIALYELADDERPVGEDSTDKANVVAAIGVTVALRRATAA